MGGDGGVLSAKAIGKRIKAKGLGRLRWYCQMCEKQCRDENGFKCHTNTPAHQRQLALFAEKPELFVAKFSDAFLQDFMAILHQRFGSNAVSANNVYQEYIKDRNHVHMNSTRWTTLTEFVKDLGRTGRCRVEDREGTWWVTFVDREVVERKKRSDAIERARLDEEELAERRIERKIEALQAYIPDPNPSQDTRYVPGDNSNLEKFEIPLNLASKARSRRGRFSDVQVDSFKDVQSTRITFEGAEGTSGRRIKAGTSHCVLDKSVAETRCRGRSPVRTVGVRVRPDSLEKSNVDSFLPYQPTGSADCENPRATSRGRISEFRHHSSPSGGTDRASGQHSSLKNDNPDDKWLRIGIVVKVVSEELAGGPLYRKKGVVASLRDEYTANIRMLDSNALLQVHQDDLETVIPKPGGLVIILRGKHAGDIGIVDKIYEDYYSISVNLRRTGDNVDGIAYEDVSKVSADFIDHVAVVG